MELNLAILHEAIAAAVPDRECIVWRDRRFTWRDITERTRRFAHVLGSAGIGAHGSPEGVAGWESVHDHVALYLYNGNEYLEAMLGAFKARAAPVNVNYRYVAEELRYVLHDSASVAVVYDARFAPTLAEVLPELPNIRLLLEVGGSDGAQPGLPGAIAYEAALASASSDPVGAEPSPDDLYILYTGGTTGMPKGVLWRQADFLVSATGVRRRDGTDYEHLDEIVDIARRGRLRALPAPPFMHGAAHWNAISAWVAGGTIVIQGDTTRFDAADVLATIERERATSLNIVGDAFARPLLEELRVRDYAVDSLRFVISGGAIFTAALKAELCERVPGLTIVDVLGSSETGRQGTATGTATGSFERSDTAVVLSADLTRVQRPGDDEDGWLAQTGRMPRGYLGDPEKTARTFPLVAGIRYAVAGDRARVAADGSVELLGRDSVTINTGGEKVFAEEVEHALKHHPAVYDAVVVGRPSERWGQEVVAVVSLREGAPATDAELLAEAGRHVARYKLPKAFVYVDTIERSPSGKPDYRWATSVVTATAGPGR